LHPKPYLAIFFWASLVTIVFEDLILIFYIWVFYTTIKVATEKNSNLNNTLLLLSCIWPHSYGFSILEHFLGALDRAWTPSIYLFIFKYPTSYTILTPDGLGVHSNKLAISYHLLYQGHSSSLSPTFVFIGHLHVEANFIMKVWEEIYHHSNKIWEDPMVAKLKLSSWGNYWNFCTFVDLDVDP
jgi:hypothetical protein